MPGAFPTADAALRAALKWEAQTLQSLKDGTPANKPPRNPKLYSDEEMLLALRVSGSDATDPLVIMREKIAALGEEAAESSSNQLLMIDVAARQAGATRVKTAGLESLSPEQSEELSRAIQGGRVPDELLSSADLPDSVRLAIARAVPEEIWTSDVEHERRYGTGETGDTSTEGAE